MEGIVVGVLLSGLLFGIGAGSIANAKGRSFGGYFLLGFIFSLVGLLIAIGMPSLKPVVAVGQSAPERAGQEPTQHALDGQAGRTNGPNQDIRAVVAELPDNKAAAIEHFAKERRISRSFTKAEVEEFSDSFKIFLADHYAIQRHEVLGKFTFRDKLYADLDAALQAARDAYMLDVDRLRQIEVCDWDKTRQEIARGTYARSGESWEVASAVHGGRKIVLWSDGALEVLVGEQPSRFCSSWNEAQAHAYFGNDAISDPLAARLFLENRGYRIEDMQVGEKAVRRIWTPEGVLFESGGKRALDIPTSDQVLVKLAIDVARSSA